MKPLQIGSVTCEEKKVVLRSLDLAHHYTGDVAPEWGAFDSSGLPTNVYVALEAFSQFTKETNQRVLSEVSSEKLSVLATLNGEHLMIGIANLDQTAKEAKLQINSAGMGQFKIDRIAHYNESWEDVEIASEFNPNKMLVPLANPGLTFIYLTRE